MDYSAYTVRELRKLAQEKWGSAAAQLKTKAELIAALKGLAAKVGVLMPDGFRPSAPLPPPSPDWQWVEQRVVDHDFFVDAGQAKPRAGTDRVFAFNQDPTVVAISWQVSEQTLNDGVSLFMVGDDGKEQSHVQVLTHGEGFAVIDALVGGPSGRAQLRHTHSGAVVATSSDVSLPVRAVVASMATPSIGPGIEPSRGTSAAPAAAGSVAYSIPTAASKRQASSW